ncbi:hypothetical protein JTP94_31710 [Rhizobium lusitanum]|nr:hypothetical protein [Rhizobium sp. RCAM05973]MBM7049712.1 hypothetical protein [Rhizobium lusitanum]
MAYDEDKCAPANVLEHAESVFIRSIQLSQQVRALVDHLCGCVPEAVGKPQDPSYANAFGQLRNRADDALSAIQGAREALHRLEAEVGFYQTEASEPKVSKARFAV